MADIKEHKERYLDTTFLMEQQRFSIIELMLQTQSIRSDVIASSRPRLPEQENLDRLQLCLEEAISKYFIIAEGVFGDSQKKIEQLKKEQDDAEERRQIEALKMHTKEIEIMEMLCVREDQVEQLKIKLAAEELGVEKKISARVKELVERQLQIREAELLRREQNLVAKEAEFTQRSSLSLRTYDPCKDVYKQASGRPTGGAQARSKSLLAAIPV